MRRVTNSSQANERLLEWVTLDVMTKRRSQAEARSLLAVFDELYRILQKDSVRLRTIGTAARWFYKLIPYRSRRVVSRRFSGGILVVLFEFDSATDECVIQSIRLE